MKRLLVIFTTLAFFLTAKGQTQLSDTVELQMRDGLPNFISKASSGQSTTIGYFGGSITDANGWRDKSLTWFREYFSNNNITGINSSIGGTNSKYGVFRLEQDLLSQGDFDLIFIEFAVNDLTNYPPEIDNSVEGIIRKIWKKNPNTDICFVHVIREGTMLDNAFDGKMPETSTIQDAVAEHYEIPTIFCGVKVVDLLNSGTVVFKGVVANAGNYTNSEGKYVFTEDGVHPTGYGHEIYSQIVTKCVRLMEGNSQALAHTLVTAREEDNYQDANMFDWEAENNHGLTQVEEKGVYSYLDNFINDNSKFLLGEDPADYYEFSYTGDILGLSIIRGPATGRAVIEIDGNGNTVDFFDPYCYYYRENNFFLSAARGTHTVKIYPGTPFTLSEKEAKLLADQRSDIQNNPSKYENNYIIFNKILINGSMNTPVTGTQIVTDSHDITVTSRDRHLLVSVPEDNIGSRLAVYNLLGNLIYALPQPKYR